MADPEIRQIVNEIESMTLQDQEHLYRQLAPWLQRLHIVTQAASSLDEVREARFAKGLVCPRCGGGKVRRHGKFRDKTGIKQRYYCRDCAKIYSDLTGTPMAHSKYQSKWGRLMSYMVEGYSCRKAALLLGVNHKTIFRWRHKVLNAMGRLAKPVLAGVVESDETYFRYSAKGQRGIRSSLGRAPRKRGESATKRGPSREQVCVLVARDRRKQTVSEQTCMGAPSVTAVKEVLTPLVSSGSVLSAPTAAATTVAFA